MFLLVLNERQSAAFLSRPLLSLGAGSLLASIAASFGGFSLYLLAAIGLPILECTLRYGSRPRVPQTALLPAAVAVLFAHAAFLAFMQGNVVGAEKLAVNIAYVFTILVGTGVGGLLFRRTIAAREES